MKVEIWCLCEYVWHHAYFSTYGQNDYVELGTNSRYDNDVLIGSYNVWQEKVVALSIPECSA